MNNREIHDEAQKLEDALKDHRPDDVAKMLVKDATCHSSDDYGKIMDAWKTIHSHGNPNAGLPEMELAAELGKQAIVDSLTGPPPAENTAAIANGDNVAGRVNNTTVVNDSDVGELQSALGSIDGSTAQGQFAQARVGAALDAAKAKMAAGRASGAGGDYAAAQQFGSVENYQAHLRKEAEDKAAAEKQTKS